jgi:hypothetical protein
MTEPQGKGLHYSIEVQGMDGLLARIPNDAKRRQVAVNILRKLTLSIEGKAKVLVHKRTGNTARDISSAVDKALLIGMVGNVSKVGRFLEEGTGIFGPFNHRIFPLHARALAWPAGISGVGMERVDMGLVEAHGMLGPAQFARAGRTLRRTGSHTSRYAKGGNAQMTYRRSIAGMRKAPFLHPAYDATLPLIPLVIEEQSKLLFEPGILADIA